MKKQLPIGVKFFGAFALVLAFVVGAVILTWMNIQAVKVSVTELRRGPFQAVAAGMAAQRDFLQLRLQLADRKGTDLPRYVEHLESVRQELNSFVHLSLNNVAKTHAERAIQMLVEWDLLARESGPDRDVRLDRLTQSIQAEIDANVKGAWDGADGMIAEVQPGVTWATFLVAGLGACTIILGLVAGLLVNDILRHLADAVGHARRIASGDLDKVIPVKRLDEPGQLLAALESMRHDLKEQQLALERLATTDTLTGLPNRRRLEEACQIQMARVKRYKEKLSVVIIDVDKFKAVNDTHGHQVGDQVLQHVAVVLDRSVRESDFVGRWGGEEFMVLCPNTAAADAGRVAEKLRAAVEAHEFPVVGTKTASFGVAELAEDEALEHAVERADGALYRAKENGRNRVEVAA